jgi:hypothetical protein
MLLLAVNFEHVSTMQEKIIRLYAFEVENGVPSFSKRFFFKRTRMVI